MSTFEQQLEWMEKLSKTRWAKRMVRLGNMEKTAARWDKMFGSLNAASRKRLMQAAFPDSPVPAQEGANVLRTIRDSPTNKKDWARLDPQTKSFYRYRKGGESENLRLARHGLLPDLPPTWHDSFNKYVSSGGKTNMASTRSDLTAMEKLPFNWGPSEQWSRLPGAAGTGSHIGNESKIESFVTHKPKAIRQAKALNSAIIEHEMGHNWSYRKPELADTTLRSVLSALKKTLPDNMQYRIRPDSRVTFRDDYQTMAGEIIAHWRATGQSRNARRFPLWAAKKHFPETLEVWSSTLPKNISPKLRDRLLATRSHLRENYVLE